MITVDDVVFVQLKEDELEQCILNAKDISFHIKDRLDLHERDLLERFNNILMGEIAEKMVIKWISEQGRFALSTVNKSSRKPDNGHDVLLKKNNGEDIYCSVKSSLSALHNVEGIINNFKLATKKSEITEVNIQVYFWLTINPRGENTNRVTVPALKQAAIIGWFGQNDIDEFTTYNHENREAPSITLKYSRPMVSLLKFIG
ncbi:hypothetical protein BZ160_15295 [Pantoea vagans]|nr:hypothetical protein [Pantoea vagans]OQV39747.1 hypothetical protein BZ160_15295 [Pantoea vagans]